VYGCRHTINQIGLAGSHRYGLAGSIDNPTSIPPLLKQPSISNSMALTTSLTNTFLLLTVLVVLLPVETYAFGAGDIPDFAYLNGWFLKFMLVSLAQATPFFQIKHSDTVTSKISLKLSSNPLEALQSAAQVSLVLRRLLSSMSVGDPSSVKVTSRKSTLCACDFICHCSVAYQFFFTKGNWLRDYSQVKLQ